MAHFHTLIVEAVTNRPLTVSNTNFPTKRAALKTGGGESLSTAYLLAHGIFPWLNTPEFYVDARECHGSGNGCAAYFLDVD